MKISRTFEKIIPKNISEIEYINKFVLLLENDLDLMRIETNENKIYFLKKNIYSFYLPKHILNNLEVSFTLGSEKIILVISTHLRQEFLFLLFILQLHIYQGYFFSLSFLIFPVISITSKIYFLAKIKILLEKKVIF